VKNIKLPFLIVPSAQPSSSEPIPISIEEVNELKATISRLEKEKEGIENDLYQVSYERNKLKFNLNKERKRLKRTEEMAKEEKGKKEQVGDCLRGATEEARKHTYLLDQANKEIHSLRSLWEQTLKGKNKMKEDFEVRILDITTSLQESQTIAVNERHLRKDIERILQNLPNNWRELLKEMQDLRERERHQKRNYEVISAQNQRLENEVRHLRDLAS
jgi:chromosome segregation ATPase